MVEKKSEGSDGKGFGGGEGEQGDAGLNWSIFNRLCTWQASLGAFEDGIMTMERAPWKVIIIHGATHRGSLKLAVSFT